MLRLRSWCYAFVLVFGFSASLQAAAPSEAERFERQAASFSFPQDMSLPKAVKHASVLVFDDADLNAYLDTYLDGIKLLRDNNAEKWKRFQILMKMAGLGHKGKAGQAQPGEPLSANEVAFFRGFFNLRFKASPVELPQALAAWRHLSRESLAYIMSEIHLTYDEASKSTTALQNLYSLTQAVRASAPNSEEVEKLLKEMELVFPAHYKVYRHFQAYFPGEVDAYAETLSLILHSSLDFDRQLTDNHIAKGGVGMTASFLLHSIFN